MLDQVGGGFVKRRREPRRQAAGVVGAEDAGGGLGEDGVQQGFVTGGLASLGQRPPSPDGLTDEACPLVGVGVGELANGRDDAAGVSAQLGHVRERHALIEATELGP